MMTKTAFQPIIVLLAFKFTSSPIHEQNEIEVPNYSPTECDKMVDISYSKISRDQLEDIIGYYTYRTSQKCINNFSIKFSKLELSENMFQKCNITTLTLRYNNLTNLPVNEIENQTAHSQDDQFSIIVARTFSSLLDLKNLILSENRIDRIDNEAFYNLTRLRQLNLYNNSITVINNKTFEGLLSLAMLNLSQNDLEEIDNGNFDLQKLKVLDLSYNQLKYLSAKCFKGLISLDVLYLNHNDLINFPEGLFEPMTSIQEINFYGNQFHCDSGIRYLYSYLNSSKINVDLKESARCYTPDELHGIAIVNFTSDEWALTTTTVSPNQKEKVCLEIIKQITYDRLQIKFPQSLAPLHILEATQNTLIFIKPDTRLNFSCFFNSTYTGNENSDLSNCCNCEAIKGINLGSKQEFSTKCILIIAFLCVLISMCYS